jgi:hypothetical protein
MRLGLVATVCALGAPLFFGLTSLRRYGLFGDEWIKFPHYAYVAFALMLPLIALGISKLFRWAPLSIVGLGILLVALLVQQGIALNDSERETGAREQAIRARLVAAAELLRRDVPVATDQPAADCCGDLDIEHLRSLDRDGKLPDVVVDRVARTSARTYLQVAVTTGTDNASGSPPLLTSIGGTDVHPRGSGCAVARTTDAGSIVRLDVSGSVRVDLLSHEGGKLALWFVPRSDSKTRDVPPTSDAFGGPAKKAVLFAGSPATLDVATAGGLLIRLPVRAAVRFCHVAVNT